MGSRNSSGSARTAAGTRSIRGSGDKYRNTSWIALLNLSGLAFKNSRSCVAIAKCQIIPVINLTTVSRPPAKSTFAIPYISVRDIGPPSSCNREIKVQAFSSLEFSASSKTDFKYRSKCSPLRPVGVVIQTSEPQESHSETSCGRLYITPKQCPTIGRATSATTFPPPFLTRLAINSFAIDSNSGIMLSIRGFTKSGLKAVRNKWCLGGSTSSGICR